MNTELPAVAANKVIVHYYRYGHDYHDWNLWGWGPGMEGKAFPFLEEDDFGRRVSVTLPNEPGPLGMLIRRGEWEAKDVPTDRHLLPGMREVWLIEGDQKIYFDKAQADRRSKITGAFLDSPDTLNVHLTNETFLIGEGGQGFALYGEDTKPIPIRSVMPSIKRELPCHTSHVRITLAKPLEVNKRYILTHPAYRSLDVIKRGVLDDPRCFYPGEDLGPMYAPHSTSFRVWAPSALSVKLSLYEHMNEEISRSIPMNRDSNGTWWIVVQGDLKDNAYTYAINVNGAEREAVDPYARCLLRNGRRGLVVDLKATDPAGWQEDKRPALLQPTDSVLYETHVRDFSIASDSGMKHRGKYLAFTEEGTKNPEGQATGIAHLKEMGITHLHLMPTQDFASVDEGGEGYNWGYDPFHYFVPEGSYATDPDGPARIREFKAMVQSLHRNGIRVIMDVVYNHTFSVDSPLDRVVPSYFYRFDPEGNHSNGSGCGNEIASERPMVRKFILDSLKYWMREYHVDGFRFDLMALLDRDTSAAIDRELHRLDPSILLYGEPWCGGESSLPPEQQLTKGAQRGLHLALFNDHFRNALKGDSDGEERGFANGASGREIGMRYGIRGAIEDFASQPSETVNYVSCHDNLTFWDKIARSNPEDSEGDRIKMDLLAQAVVLTSQGIPFLHGGEEFLRTKGGNHNSYNAGDAVNRMEWSRKSKYRDVFEYLKGLIRLRREHPAFRMASAEQIRKNLVFLPSQKGTVAFQLVGHANGDPWDSILVAFNQTRISQPLILPDPGRWVIVVNDKQAGTVPVKESAFVQGDASIPPLSALVMFR